MKKKEKERNIAFIDAQNLHLWTKTDWWKVDFKRFRIYIKDKFKVDEAYFFLWFVDDDYQNMYRKIQRAGFILEFREHNTNMKGKKKSCWKGYKAVGMKTKGNRKVPNCVPVTRRKK